MPIDYGRGGVGFTSGPAGSSGGLTGMGGALGQPGGNLGMGAGGAGFVNGRGPANLGTGPVGIDDGPNMQFGQFGGRSPVGISDGLMPMGAGGGARGGQTQQVGQQRQSFPGQQPGMTQPSGAPSAPPPANNGGNPTLTAYQQSPYLSGMADDISRRTQQGLGQAFGGIRSNSVGVGGLGGSRQGVAQGIATSGAMDSMQGQLANLYGQDYNNQMNRNLQQYQADQTFNLGQGNLALGNLNSNRTYELGQGNLALGNRTADQNYALGQGNLALGNLNANNNFTLGQGNLALGNLNANNSYNLGMTNAGNQRYGTELNYGLGMTNAANQRYASDQNYNLGLGQQGLTNQGQQLSFYGQQRAQDMDAARLGMQMYGLGTEGSWTPINNANNVFNNFTGYGQSTTSGNPGSWQSILGGALAGGQAARNMGWW